MHSKMWKNLHSITEKHIIGLIFRSALQLRFPFKPVGVMGTSEGQYSFNTCLSDIWCHIHPWFYPIELSNFTPGMNVANCLLTGFGHIVVESIFLTCRSTFVLIKIVKQLQRYPTTWLPECLSPAGID